MVSRVDPVFPPVDNAFDFSPRASGIDSTPAARRRSSDFWLGHALALSPYDGRRR